MHLTGWWIIVRAVLQLGLLKNWNIPCVKLQFRRVIVASCWKCSQVVIVVMVVISASHLRFFWPSTCWYSPLSRMNNKQLLDITKTESNNCFIVHWRKKKNGSHVFASSLTASNTKRANLTWLPLEIMHRGHTWHDYSWPWESLTWLLYNLQLDDVTGADFENSLYAFGQSRKS